MHYSSYSSPLKTPLHNTVRLPSVVLAPGIYLLEYSWCKSILGIYCMASDLLYTQTYPDLCFQA